MKNTHKLPGPAEASHDDRARAADPLPGVKEDQMMGPEVFSAMGFAAGTFSKRMRRGKWCRRCCGLFRCPEVVFVFVSIQTEPRLEVIMLDWLRGLRDLSVLLSMRLCRHATAACLNWGVKRSPRRNRSRLKHGLNQMTLESSGFAGRVSTKAFSL